VDDTRTTVNKLTITTTLWSTSTPQSGWTTPPVRSRSGCPRPAQQPHAYGTLDTTRPTIVFLKPLDFPHATSIDTSNGVFTSAANAALETAMETLCSVTSTPKEKAYAYALIDVAMRTHQAVASAGEARLTYMRRFHAKKISNGEERVAERLLYSRCFGTTAADRGENVVDGLLSALEDKLLEVNVTSSAKAQGVAHTSPDYTDQTRPTTSRTRRTITRPSLRTARLATPSPLPTRHTKRPRPTRRNDGVTRRADSCTLYSNYVRHRVRRDWQG
jgi:hypothetical protein